MVKKLNMIGSGAVALPIQASTFGSVQGSGVSTLGFTGRLRGSGDVPAPDSVGPGLLG